MSDGDVSKDIVWHDHSVDRELRERQLGQRGCVIWFTGLSGCGKSTIANAVDAMLIAQGRATVLLDGEALEELEDILIQAKAEGETLVTL